MLSEKAQLDISAYSVSYHPFPFSFAKAEGGRLYNGVARKILVSLIPPLHVSDNDGDCDDQ